MSEIRVYDRVAAIRRECNHGRLIGMVCGCQRTWAAENGEPQAVFKADNSLRDFSLIAINGIENQILIGHSSRV